MLPLSCERSSSALRLSRCQASIQHRLLCCKECTSPQCAAAPQVIDNMREHARLRQAAGEQQLDTAGVRQLLEGMPLLDQVQQSDGREYQLRLPYTVANKARAQTVNVQHAVLESAVALRWCLPLCLYASDANSSQAQQPPRLLHTPVASNLLRERLRVAPLKRNDQLLCLQTWCTACWPRGRQGCAPWC